MGFEVRIVHVRLMVFSTPYFFNQTIKMSDDNNIPSFSIFSVYNHNYKEKMSV